MAAVQGKNLVKYYKKFKALNSVTFEIKEGECFGFLGPNGAGKTTLMGMIYGFITPSEGEIEIFNQKFNKHTLSEIKKRIGVIPQDNNLDPDLNVLENLIVYARYFDINRKKATQKAIELLEFVKLDDWISINVRKLSGGMQRKLIFARGLINDPDLIILDEPTTGLDPRSRRQIWEKIEVLKHSGKTLILTTHYMEEAEKLCDRIAMMDKGKILVIDTPENLSIKFGGNLEHVYLNMTEG
ncbi:MAG TPA: ABC transporter ATP-binding protein [Thermodesulfovibrio thiophilus]|uniref:ABC transporter ATP-binding protein n=1 Tax=Thermodesulfovibrio thiophilus TaxID=340095 RepID=UPI00042956E8|nr:ABC transporter ATP-binding protein [Thermodesulfovibrio thiophilus]HHW21189.1 ABC transporter ATP-binding protein [Thermodesulfovibrio thiophilus]HOA82436.1 ABC transporter ATP-binding protein [Thermodesulfovibrio thiophilus]HQD36208.1 ABC transporter ATP-binding protein [Thermodesulfovibrio thiophilus]